MYFPKHQIRDYCTYLGSLLLDDKPYDLGVYEQKDGTVSHAIVFGERDEEYASGEFIFEGRPCRSFSGVIYKINELAYKHHKEEESK